MLIMESNEHSEVLVDRAQEGDRSAFEQLVEANRARLEALIRSRLGQHLRSEVEVEDVNQETLLQAFSSIARFRWQGEQSFVRWLGGIAENVIRKEQLDRQWRMLVRGLDESGMDTFRTGQNIQHVEIRPANLEEIFVGYMRSENE